MKTALYSGSFDPCTNGHVWVIRKTIQIFDKLIVCIGVNADKKTSFTFEQRKNIIEETFKEEVKSGKLQVVLLEEQFIVNYCRDNHIDFIVRGVRNVKDLEFEQQILYVNEKINPSVQTIYLIPPVELGGLSSSMVKGLVNNYEWQLIIKDIVPNPTYSALLLQKNVEKFKFNLDLTIMYSSFLCDNFNEDDDFYKKLLKNYTEPHRFFHTLNHINECFDCARENDFHLNNIQNWSLIFHDFIYYPDKDNNEQRSCNEFRKFVDIFSPQNLKEQFYNEVETMIMATKDHVSNNEQIQQILDCDMSIFCSNSLRFKEYERQIREEYSFAGKQYIPKRIEFLQNLLNKERIFYLLSSEKELKARENINNLILDLKNEKSF